MDTRLHFLFNNSTDFFLVLDRHGTIVYTNSAFRNVSGYSENDLETKKAVDICHPADRKRLEELLKTITERIEITGHEFRIKAKNGRYYNIKWSMILNPEDGLIYTTGTNLVSKLNGTSPHNITDNLQHIVESFGQGVFVIDRNWQITSFNPAFQAITGLTGKELKDIHFTQLVSMGMPADVMNEFERAFDSNSYVKLQYFNGYFNRWLRLNIYPYKNELTVLVRDITRVKTQQLVLALEKRVLELNASSRYSLAQTIDQLLIGVEEIFPDMICSVLEVDDAQEKIYHLAAPRLSAEYCNIINGSLIGPKEGSCGTSVYHRSQVIVSDIETDPLWEDFKDLIRPYGLKACWSTPIIGSHSSKVLATFAIYYTTPREPKDDELQMIERTVNILRVLIENKKNQEHVNDQTSMLQEIAAISSHELRRPVATILGLVSLFDKGNPDNPLNNEIVGHLEITAQELDNVIHTIVKKTIYLKSGE